MVILIVVNNLTSCYSNVDNSVVEKNLEKLNQIIDSNNPEEIDQMLAQAQMTSSISQNKIEPRKIFARSAIIGDSMAEAIVDYRILDESNVFAVRGKRLDSSDELIDKVNSFKPDKLFIEFGMNDITRYHGKVEPFIETYTKVIHNFKKSIPNTELYVVSIHTLGETGIKENKYMGNYLKYNEGMKKMCKREHVKYMDTTVLIGEDSEYEFDGLHPKEPYYTNWVKLMCSVIMEDNN